MTRTTQAPADDNPLPDIIEQLKIRTGKSYTEVCRLMSVRLKYDYTVGTFHRKFRRTKTSAAYSFEEMMALVAAYTQGLPKGRRCEAHEALRLFSLAKISLDDAKRLRSLFPEEFDSAWRNYAKGDSTNDTFLASTTELFFQVIAKTASTELIAAFNTEAGTEALKKAIGRAVRAYSRGERLPWAQALVHKDGLLSLSDVQEELAKIFTLEGEPNTQLIANHWQALLPTELSTQDLGKEAKRLIEAFEREFQTIPGVYAQQSPETFDQHRASSTANAETLAEIESSLNDLIDLVDTRFGELYTRFSQATYNLRDKIRSFDSYILDKTRGFVGRDFVFKAFQEFIDQHPSGYFIIRGEPGIGKSALAAQLTKSRGYIHHFNIRAEGINKASDFLTNICAQLIAGYNLNYPALPQETTVDAAVFNKLLTEVSAKLAGDACAIVVDALDEVDMPGLPPGTNILYLPTTLPDGIFIVTTARKIPLSLTLHTSHQTLDIEEDDVGNMADVRSYIIAHLRQTGIQTYIQAQDIDDARFVDNLQTKSQGNFMYLRYILPDIEKGFYKDLSLEALPAGLMNYYDYHWQRMKGQDVDAWFRYKLPVLVALTAAKESIPLELIRAFSEVSDTPRIRAVLQEWEQFLHTELADPQNGLQSRYRLYHTSFFDFIWSKQEVADERVDIVAKHGHIADYLWDQFYKNRPQTSQRKSL